MTSHSQFSPATQDFSLLTLNNSAEHNILSESPEHARVLSLESAILLEQEMDRIKQMDEFNFKSRVIDTTWSLTEGAAGLEVAVKNVCAEVEKAVDEGIDPSLLITGAAHHHLNTVKKRMRASIVVETAEARDTHQVACLFGFGATAVCPYLGYATVRQVVATDVKGKLGEGMSSELAMTNYRKALEKGLLKIMSKMGISVLNSYQGAQIFEAVGIGSDVMDLCFTGCQSRIAGIGFAEIADESIIRHRAAYADIIEKGVAITEPLTLEDPGYFRYRKAGERHAITTDVIKNFHTFVRDNKKEDYDAYVQAALETHPVTIKDLLEFVPLESGPVPLEEVEPIENIRRRFTTRLWRRWRRS